MKLLENSRGKSVAFRTISYEQTCVIYQLEIAFISSVMVAAITEKGCRKQRELDEFDWFSYKYEKPQKSVDFEAFWLSQIHSYLKLSILSNLGTYSHIEQGKCVDISSEIDRFTQRHSSTMARINIDTNHHGRTAFMLILQLWDELIRVSRYLLTRSSWSAVVTNVVDSPCHAPHYEPENSQADIRTSLCFARTCHSRTPNLRQTWMCGNATCPTPQPQAEPLEQLRLLCHTSAYQQASWLELAANRQLYRYWCTFCD